MIIKGLVEEDFANYSKPSMFVITPTCSFKCDKECGQAVCQNMPLISQPNIDVDDDVIISHYMSNAITRAIVIGGLEPFDSPDLYNFIWHIRQITKCDIVIYTGYYEHEIQLYIDRLKNDFNNIIVKFGRYIPNQQPHYDEVLGVMLASDNQKGVKIC